MIEKEITTGDSEIMKEIVTADFEIGAGTVTEAMIEVTLIRIEIMKGVVKGIEIGVTIPEKLYM